MVNWVLQYIKNPNVCEIISNKINETIFEYPLIVN
jgi:hypothetical protein